MILTKSHHNLTNCFKHRVNSALFAKKNEKMYKQGSTSFGASFTTRNENVCTGRHELRLFFFTKKNEDMYREARVWFTEKNEDIYRKARGMTFLFSKKKKKKKKKRGHARRTTIFDFWGSIMKLTRICTGKHESGILVSQRQRGYLQSVCAVNARFFLAHVMHTAAKTVHELTLRSSGEFLSCCFIRRFRRDSQRAASNSSAFSLAVAKCLSFLGRDVRLVFEWSSDTSPAGLV